MLKTKKLALSAVAAGVLTMSGIAHATVNFYGYVYNVYGQTVGNATVSLWTCPYKNAFGAECWLRAQTKTRSLSQTVPGMYQVSYGSDSADYILSANYNGLLGWAAKSVSSAGWYQVDIHSGTYTGRGS